MQRSRSAPSTWAVGIIGLGGVLMIVGSILPFVVGSAGGPFEGQTSSGIRYADGKFDLGVGVGLVVIAALLWALRLTLFGARILAAVAIVGAAIILYATIVDVSDVGKLPEVEIGIGLYVVLAGSIAGLIGGVVSFIGRGRAAPSGPDSGGPPLPAPPTPGQPPEPPSL
jgi:hypothetical protein